MNGEIVIYSLIRAYLLLKAISINMDVSIYLFLDENNWRVRVNSWEGWPTSRIIGLFGLFFAIHQ